jgi:hypothetical protein
LRHQPPLRVRNFLTCFLIGNSWVENPSSLNEACDCFLQLFEMNGESGKVIMLRSELAVNWFSRRADLPFLLSAANLSWRAIHKRRASKERVPPRHPNHRHPQALKVRSNLSPHPPTLLPKKTPSPLTSPNPPPPHRRPRPAQHPLALRRGH